MHTRLVALFSLILVALAATPLHAMGDKKKPFSVSAHIETDANENPKMIFPQAVGGQTRYFRRIPEISTKDIISFSPFPTEAGAFGVVFRLKDNAAKRYSAVTNVNQQRWLLIMVNGRFTDAVLIDQPINDGLLVVWKGITLADIELFGQSLPRIGEENKKK
jgi:hypothetical protein